MAAETPLGVVGEKLTETATKQIFDTANKIVKSKLKLDKTEEKNTAKSEFTTKFCCKISRNRTAKMWSCFYMLKIGEKRKRR